MKSLTTTIWFEPDGARTSRPVDSPLPTAQWAAVARSRDGWVQMVVRGRDASLHYDPGKASPDALQAAERALDRPDTAPGSVTLVEWHGEQITRRVLSRLDAEHSDLFEGLASF